MSELARYSMEVEKFEEILDRLTEALCPKVVFSEDMESMRRDAELVRAEQIDAVRTIIVSNVVGLRVGRSQRKS